MLMHTALDARDARGLAEFYRQLLGLHYRPGDEPPLTDGGTDDADWLVLLDDLGRRVLAVQRKADTTPPTWPSEDVPMQLHLDFQVTSAAELERHRARRDARSPAPARPVGRARRAALRHGRPSGPSVLSARPAPAGRAGQLKESPQAQECPALGLSIVKPCFSIVSAKSIVAPMR